MYSKVTPGRGTKFEKYRKNFERTNGNYSYDDDLNNAVDFINKEFGEDNDYDDYNYFSESDYDDYDDYRAFQEWKAQNRKAVRERENDAKSVSKLHVQPLDGEPRSEEVFNRREYEDGRQRSADNGRTTA